VINYNHRVRNKNIYKEVQKNYMIIILKINIYYHYKEEINYKWINMVKIIFLHTMIQEPIKENLFNNPSFYPLLIKDKELSNLIMNKINTVIEMIYNFKILTKWKSNQKLCNI
jgi:hypothetical protein